MDTAYDRTSGASRLVDQLSVREDIIRTIVQRIVDRFAPEMVVLFGSYARGDAGPDSDVDLLVVMPIEGSVRAAAARIDASLSPRELPIDIVVATPEYVARKRNIVGTLVYPALREGCILYARQ